MPVQFVFTRLSKGHLAISCYNPGLRYEVFDTKKSVSVYCWDATRNQNVMVGEFTRCSLWRDKIRFECDARWIPVKEFLYKHGASRCRAFKSDDGLEYVWERRDEQLILHQSFILCAEPAAVLMTFHENDGAPSLECHDASLLHSLDKIIVSLLMMDRRIFEL